MAEFVSRDLNYWDDHHAGEVGFLGNELMFLTQQGGEFGVDIGVDGDVDVSVDDDIVDALHASLSETDESSVGTTEASKIKDKKNKQLGNNSNSTNSSNSSSSSSGGSSSINSSTSSTKSTNSGGETKSEKNKAACAKYRQKRKRKIDEIRKRTSFLETEREILRLRITELQQELQVLRAGAQVDLEKEHQLLKSQVFKHRKFVQQVLQAASVPPETVPVEEQYRLIQLGVESGIGQVLGLAYTSAVDPTWKDACSLPFDVGEIKLKYQYLPLGSTRENAKRLNLRYEAVDMPHDWEFAHSQFLKPYTDPRYMQHCTRGTVKEMTLEELKKFEKEKGWEESSIKLFQYKEKVNENQTSEYIFASSTKEVNIFEKGILGGHRTDVEWSQGSDGLDSGAHVAKVIVQSSTPTQVLKDAQLLDHADSDGVSTARCESQMVLGSIYWKRGENQSGIVWVETYPLSDAALSSISDCHCPYVTDDGQLSEEYLKDMYAVYNMLFHNGPLADPDHGN